MPRIASAFTLLGAHSQDEALKNLAAAGVDAIRQDFLWARIEPKAGVYDFSFEDKLVDTAARRGIEVIPILAYGNPLYARAGSLARTLGVGGGIPPFGIGAEYLWPPDPENLPAYMAFAKATAAHFADRVDRWEVWNEENVGWRFWPPHEDPSAYSALLRAGSKGLRAGDRTSQVSSGGVFYPEVPPGLPEQGGLRYLGNVYAADPAIGETIDAIAWHPYPYPFVAPEVVIPANSSVPGSAEQVRAFLREQGDANKALWVTEIGWPTHADYGVSEERQAAYLARSFAELWAQGVELITWYTYADGPNSEHNQEDAFGLFTYDGTPKPSYHALKTFTSVLGRAVFEGSRSAELDLEANEHALAFARKDARVTMLWTSPESLFSDYGYLQSSDLRRKVSMPVQGSAHLVSMTGKAKPIRPRNGRIMVEISPFPVYVID